MLRPGAAKKFSDSHPYIMSQLQHVSRLDVCGINTFLNVSIPADSNSDFIQRAIELEVTALCGLMNDRSTLSLMGLSSVHMPS